jgi:hypothetical protein
MNSQILMIIQFKYHNILEPVLGRSSENSKNLVEPLEPRLHVSLKWKKHTYGSREVSITT